MGPSLWGPFLHQHHVPKASAISTQLITILWVDERGVERSMVYWVVIKMNGETVQGSPMMKMNIRTPKGIDYTRLRCEFGLDYALNRDE